MQQYFFDNMFAKVLEQTVKVIIPGIQGNLTGLQLHHKGKAGSNNVGVGFLSEQWKSLSLNTQGKSNITLQHIQGYHMIGN